MPHLTKILVLFTLVNTAGLTYLFFDRNAPLPQKGPFIIKKEETGQNCKWGGIEIRSGSKKEKGENTTANESHFICNASPGKKGKQGEKGFTSIIIPKVLEPGEECLEGGLKISVGIDNGSGSSKPNDNKLEDDEINEIKYLCNGLRGTRGKSGFASLIETIEIGPGNDCKYGGKVILTGLDNGNGNTDQPDGKLQQGEIVSKTLFCERIPNWKPMAISKSRSSFNSITVSWNKHNTAEGYKVYLGSFKNLSAQFFEEVKILDLDKSSTTFRGLHPNKKYYLAISYLRDGFESQLSEKFQLKTKSIVFSNLPVKSYNRPYFSLSYLNGNPIISVFDEKTNSLQFLRKNKKNIKKETIDKKNTVGKFNSTQVDQRKIVHVSYYDTTSRDLKYASKRKGKWSTEIVDKKGTVGSHSDLRIAKESPVIAYYKSSNESVRLAKKINSKWEIETVGKSIKTNKIKLVEASRKKISLLLFNELTSSLELYEKRKSVWKKIDLLKNVSGFEDFDIILSDKGFYLTLAQNRIIRIYLANFKKYSPKLFQTILEEKTSSISALQCNGQEMFFSASNGNLKLFELSKASKKFVHSSNLAEIADKKPIQASCSNNELAVGFYSTDRNLKIITTK